MSYVAGGNIIELLWLIVEWKTSKNKHDGYSLVSSEDLANKFSLQDLHTGKVVKIKSGKRVRKASIVIVSGDRGFLEMEIKLLQEAAQQIGLLKKPAVSSERYQTVAGGRAAAPESAVGELSLDGSDWQPDSNESDSETENVKKVKKANPKSGRGWRNSSKSLQQVKSSPKSLNQYPNIKENTLNRHSSPGINEYFIDPRRQSGNIVELPGQFVIDNASYMSERNNEIAESPSLSHTYKERQKPFQQPKNDIDPNRGVKMAVPPMTFDQQTQTSVSNANGVNIELLCENHNRLSAEVSYLHKTLNDLRNQMESMQRSISDVAHFERQGASMSVNHETNAHMEFIDNSMVIDESNGNGIILRDSNSRHSADRVGNMTAKHDESSYTLCNIPIYQTEETSRDQSAAPAMSPRNLISETADMVPIGSGATLVPRHIFRQINWTSYSHATRKLLMAVFPRRTLATHSLTGKSSPAFVNKPAKMQLDVKKITDIIVAVTDLCKVQENLVRNIITTKCADENKMYRLRMEKMKSKKSREFEANQENQFP